MSLTIHNPYVPRLIRSATTLQQIINSNALFEAYDGEERKAGSVSCAIDEFNAAVGQVSVGERLATTSPFTRYRIQILGGYSTGLRLSTLVLHLFNGNQWVVDLPSLLANADEEHVRIALECCAWYAQHGENDQAFMALGREILRRDHPELFEDEEV